VTAELISIEDSQTTARSFGQIHFRHPTGWHVEPLSQIDGLLVVDPLVERSWRANVFFELLPRVMQHDPDRRLRRIEDNLRSIKTAFHCRRRLEIDGPLAHHHANAWKRPVRLIEYDAMEDGVALTQWEGVWPLPAKQDLVITAASECTLWPKYAPIFESLIRSLVFEPRSTS
jgi:hypothetical protein